MFFIIFLQVTVNLFSKYNIQNITIKETGKKEININNKNLKAPYYKLPQKSYIKLFTRFKNKRNHGSKIIERRLKGYFFIRKIKNRLFLYQRLELNEYTLGVLNSELKDIDKFPTEALKAFYLVIKNYTLTHLKRHKKTGADFCDNAHCQLYYGNIKYINNLTKISKEKIYYNGAPAITPYSSSCGKYTCDSDIIWNKNIPYLKGKKLKTELSKWSYKLYRKDLMKITGKSQINKLIIKNGCVKGGENFRRKINKNLGWNKIKSNVFKIKEYKNYYLITGSGFGHNVGFCIKEAEYLANHGMNYREIIKYFFNGVEIR